MSLPTPSAPREPLHDRSIRARSYLRRDGLIDIDAELLDVKGYDYHSNRKGARPAGAPVHQMQLRLTVDADFNIVEAVAAYDEAPYDEHCTGIGADYAKLVGLNLAKGFRQQVRELLGGIAGCTHMSELATVLPTVAIQSMARMRRENAAANPNRRPFAIDGCHAQRNDGPVVREVYPQWYGVPKGGSPRLVEAGVRPGGERGEGAAAPQPGGTAPLSSSSSDS